MAKRRPGKRERTLYKIRLLRAEHASRTHDPDWSARSCLDRVPTTDYASDYQRTSEHGVNRPSAPKRPSPDVQVTRRGKRETVNAVDPQLLNYDPQLISDAAFERDVTKRAKKRADDEEKKWFK